MGRPCTHAHCVTESVVNVQRLKPVRAVASVAMPPPVRARQERNEVVSEVQRYLVLRAFVRRLCAVVRQCAVLQCAGVLPCAGRCAVEGGAVLRFVRSIRVG